MLKRTIGVTLICLLLTTVTAFGAEKPAGIERTTVNGMTVLLQKTPSKLAEFALLLKAGNGLDPAGKKGTAEVMNNLVYLKLLNSKEELGQIEMTTNPDYTLITIKTGAKNAPNVLNEIKDLFIYPLYEYDVITDLKKLLRSEIVAIPGYLKAYYQFGREFYGADHPYNDQPDAAQLQEITGHDVYRWYRQTYQPGNAILSISGGIDEEPREVEKYFSRILNDYADRSLTPRPVFPEKTKKVDFDDPNGRVTSICLGLAAPRMRDPEYPAFRIISYYLEEYQHYFEELRVKETLIYSGFVYYNYLEKPQAPSIVFLTMTNPESLAEVEAKTLEVINDLVVNGIKPEVINKITAALKKELTARDKAGKGIAVRNALGFYLGNQLVYSENFLPLIEKVTTDDIKKAAEKYFKNYVRVAYIPKSIPEQF